MVAVCWQLQLFCKVGFCAVGFVCLANVLQCAVGTKTAFTAEVIRFAQTIVSGEYDQNQALLEEAKMKAAAKKKQAVKKPVKKK